MAATLTDLNKNFVADQEGTRFTYLSIHTANPGTTGASEASGGTYVRQALTFNAAGAIGPLGGTLQPATVGVAWSNEVTFDLLAGVYTHFGTWTASTAGTYRAGNVLASSVSLSANGQAKVSIGVGPVSGA